MAGCSASPDGPDAFWSALQYSASEVEQYGTVADMAASADLVVVGSVASIGVGRTWGSEDPDDRVASLVLEVEVAEVLRGTPIPGAEETVSVERDILSLLPDALREGLRTDGIQVDTSTFAEIPRGSAVWFLRLSDDLGLELEPAEVAYAGGQPYRLVNSLGLVVESRGGEAGTPLVPAGHDEDREPALPEELFAADLASLGFDGVLDAARR